MTTPITLNNVNSGDGGRDILRESMDRINENKARQQTILPVGESVDMLPVTSVNPILGGLNQASNALFAAPKARAVAEQREQVASNTGDVLSFLGDIKTAEDWQAQKESFGDAFLSERYGENIDLSQIRPVRGKMETDTNAYSFDKGIDALLPQLGTMSEADVTTSIQQLAQKYDVDAKDARQRIAAATEQGRANTTEVQQENLALAQTDINSMKNNVIAEQQLDFRNKLDAEGIDPATIDSVYDADRDDPLKAAWWKDIADNDKNPVNTKNAKATVAKFEEKYGNLSYADLVLLVDTRDPLLWGASELEIEDSRLKPLRDKFKKRNADVGMYNKLKLHHDTNIKDATDELDRTFNKYQGKVQRNALTRTASGQPVETLGWEDYLASTGSGKRLTTREQQLQDQITTLQKNAADVAKVKKAEAENTDNTDTATPPQVEQYMQLPPAAKARAWGQLTPEAQAAVRLLNAPSRGTSNFGNFENEVGDYSISRDTGVLPVSERIRSAVGINTPNTFSESENKTLQFLESEEKRQKDLGKELSYIDKQRLAKLRSKQIRLSNK